VIRGGLRTRLVVDSTRVVVIASLSALGWFDETVHDDPPGLRRHMPLRYVPKPLKWDETVEPNAIAISADDTHSLRRGLGGEVEDNMRVYVDLFVESDELGWHLAQDVRDILIGKMPEIGRDSPSIEVYDLRLATPAAFTQVDVERPLIDRAESESREWRNRWFMVRFDLVDEYYDEFGSVDIDLAVWADELSPVWQQIQLVEAGS
jgi:hypothetical protein